MLSGKIRTDGHWFSRKINENREINYEFSGENFVVIYWSLTAKSEEQLARWFVWLIVISQMSSPIVDSKKHFSVPVLSRWLTWWSMRMAKKTVLNYTKIAFFYPNAKAILYSVVSFAIAQKRCVTTWSIIWSNRSPMILFMHWTEFNPSIRFPYTSRKQWSFSFAFFKT